jgi:AcrR family transcriptional regulator
LTSVVKTNKGEQTRALILETALRLFRERGYEETTMRLIAEEAGVSLGNAYYYFRSKDDLVHAFYARLQEAQFAACEAIFATEQQFKGRLTGVIRAHLALCTPYQRMFVSLFRIAADPQNPLNPFHSETATVRQQCIERFALLVNGSQEKIPADLREELPYLLWLYHLAIILFWIYDSSPGYVRTYRLLELSSDIVANLIALASLPPLLPLRRSALKLIAAVK